MPHITILSSNLVLRCVGVACLGVLHSIQLTVLKLNIFYIYQFISQTHAVRQVLSLTLHKWEDGGSLKKDYFPKSLQWWRQSQG